jgi:hypothetical protein
MTYPQPVPTVAKVQLYMDFITALGWSEIQEVTWPLFPGPEITDIGPDRAVFITPTPGPGYVTDEAALDCGGFQALTRGPANDPLTPGLVAQQLDVLLLNARTPMTVDGVTISLVMRSGGPPTPLPLDPNNRLFEYVCTYLITTGLE